LGSALGLVNDGTARRMGPIRLARFAMIIDDLKVIYIGVESAPGVTVSGAPAVLAKL
ncbi:peroxiredoxin type-2, partial [Coemansia sp. S100]